MRASAPPPRSTKPRRANAADQPALQLQAARAWLQADRPADAARALRGITATVTPQQTTERRVIEADIDLANGQAQRAWQKISAIPEPTGTAAAPHIWPAACASRWPPAGRSMACARR